MIELPIVIGLIVGFFGFGMCAGMVLHYMGEYRSLRDDYRELVHTLTFMKKQGFVPQFDIEQPTETDPSTGIDET